MTLHITPPVRRFLRTLADMTKEGEDNGSGEPYVQEPDDAFETLESLISEARELLGEPADRPHIEDEA